MPLLVRIKAKYEDAPKAKREDAAGAALCMQPLQSSLLVRSASNVVELVCQFCLDQLSTAFCSARPKSALLQD